MTEGEIAVFGGAHIDRRGRITGTTAPGRAIPAPGSKRPAVVASTLLAIWRAWAIV